MIKYQEGKNISADVAFFIIPKIQEAEADKAFIAINHLHFLLKEIFSAKDEIITLSSLYGAIVIIPIKAQIIFHRYINNIIERALKIFPNTLGNEHPSVADTYNNLGLVHAKKGDYDSAIEYCEMALKIYENSQLPKDHLSIIGTKNNINNAKNKRSS
jgi:tetratricopeptide (TPR) repeat protein